MEKTYDVVVVDARFLGPAILPEQFRRPSHATLSVGQKEAGSRQHQRAIDSAVLHAGGRRVQVDEAGGSIVGDVKRSVSRPGIDVPNAPSPTATAPQAIAARLVDEIDDAFGSTSTAGGRTTTQTNRRS